MHQAQQQEILADFARHHLPSPLHSLDAPPFDNLAKEAGVLLSIKRDDLIHPYISGNKWRKLLGTAKYAIAHQIKTIISFGGAYSNHLVALATLGEMLELQIVAIIRGEPPAHWNSRLQYLKAKGVALHFVSREEYRARDELAYQSAWQQRYTNSLVVPEGGSNDHSREGMAGMVAEVQAQIITKGLPPVDIWVLPVGSGGSMAGLMATTKNSASVWGVCVLKGAGYLREAIGALADDVLPENVHKVEKFLQNNRHLLWHGFDAGGYAKESGELRLFLQSLTGVPVEPVYSGKLLWALADWLQGHQITSNQHVMVLHTGGLWPEL